MATIIYLLKWIRNLGDPSPKKNIGGPKHQNFSPFFKLGNLIANISRTKQDIVERKTVLQTAISPAHAHLIW